jgi:hypothetical protein
VYELDSLYAYNGHNTGVNPDNINSCDDSEQGDFESESKEKPIKKPLKNWLILGGVILVTLLVAKNHNKFISNVTSNNENEQDKVEISANPAPNTINPAEMSGDDYYRSLLPALTENQRIELEMQSNRFIWLMKNNLVKDAKSAKGTSAEEYLLNRLKNILFQWQEKIADRKYDFSSAIGIEEGLLLIPRVKALLLAYEEVTGDEVELSTFKNGDKVPPNFAGMVAGLKQLHQVAETIRLNAPEAQIRQDVLEKRIEELERKLNNPKPEIKESPAP